MIRHRIMQKNKKNEKILKTEYYNMDEKTI